VLSPSCLLFHVAFVWLAHAALTTLGANMFFDGDRWSAGGLSWCYRSLNQTGNTAWPLRKRRPLAGSAPMWFTGRHVSSGLSRCQVGGFKRLIPEVRLVFSRSLQLPLCDHRRSAHSAGSGTGAELLSANRTDHPPQLRPRRLNHDNTPNPNNGRSTTGCCGRRAALTLSFAVRSREYAGSDGQVRRRFETLQPIL